MAEQLFRGNREPSINDLLTDEISRLLRAADGVDLADVLREIETAKSETFCRRRDRTLRFEICDE